MKKVARMDHSRRLQEKRKKIDLIDRKLLSLFNQRLRLALEIGKVKEKTGKRIYIPSRERKILEGLKSRNKGPLKGKDLEKIFRTIMTVCRRSQKLVNSEVPL